MRMKKYDPIPIEEIKAAQERIKDAAIRTPLVKLNVDDAPAEIYLKLENLQPIGSFKIRGASNAIKKANPEDLKEGVWTMSAGNHGQGVAWNARKLGIKCTIHSFEFAAQTKIDAMERLGAKVELIPVKHPMDIQQFKAFLDPNGYPNQKGLCIHPVSDPAVMAGQGTIGLEILEDLPKVDTILMPWGGGGLSCGIASAIRALKPEVKLYGCEVDTVTPLASSFKAGKRVDVEMVPSFVDSIGLPHMMPEMWDLGKRLLDGALVAKFDEVVSTVRLLADRNKIIAEGASATPVAIALSGQAGDGKVVCVISGGSIDLDKLVKIFQGKTP
jgi:threonine dehydratase